MAASEAAATAGVLVVALMMTAVLATSSLVISLHNVINGFCSKQIYNPNSKNSKFYSHSGYLYYIDVYKKWSRLSQTTVIDTKTTAIKMQLNSIGLTRRNRLEH